MPSRIIREGILTSERVNALDAGAEVFYRRLMSKVDDHGLYDARPSILRTSLYPLRVDRVREADCTRWIAACEMAGLIALYTHDGKPYLQMLDTRWTARSEPKYPLPSDGDFTKPPAPENTCAQLKTPVPVFGVVVVDGVVSSPPPRGDGVSYFDEFWKAYPNKAGKDAARKAFAKRKVTRELLDEMLSAIMVQRQSKKWTDDGGQYIPNPATWLNAGCWQDEGVQVSAPVVAPKGPDPALAKIESDRLKAAPIPENIRQQLQSLRGNGVSA